MNVRYYGITDDVTTCEHCGRTGLKHTVMLEILDADGNGDGIMHYGSDCAAKMLGTASAAIRRNARAAESRREAAVQWARHTIKLWEPVENDKRELIRLFWERNPNLRCKGVRASESVAKLLAEAREVIATGGISALS